LQKQESPLVSVIIPTLNAALYLEKCLQSLKHQTYPKVEIIVVDKFSTDETQEIATRMGVKLILGGRERSEQTNIGVRSASGQYVYRTDADYVFEPTVIFDAVDRIQSGYDAVVIRGASDPTVSLWAKVRAAERECYMGDWAHTAAAFFKRDVFLAMGGFNERLTAFEEYDLHNRLLAKGYRIGTINAKATHLDEPRSLARIVRRYVYYGNRRNVREFASRNPNKGLWQLSPLRLVYVKNLRKFRVYFIPFLVYYYAKYASALIGFLFGGDSR